MTALAMLPAVAEFRSALERAEAFVLDALSSGPIPSRRLEADAQAAGISGRTLRRACDQLGIRRVRVGGLAARGEWVATLDAKAAKDEWRTPPELFDELDAGFSFALDAAATRENALCPAFYTLTDDGLRRPWATWAWCNPPYSSQGEWIAKAASECDQRGVGSMLLLRSDPSTRAWHAHVEGKREVRHLPGRLRFLTPDCQRLGPAPFASVVVVFRPRGDGRS